MSFQGVEVKGDASGLWPPLMVNILVWKPLCGVDVDTPGVGVAECAYSWSMGASPSDGCISPMSFVYQNMIG